MVLRGFPSFIQKKEKDTRHSQNETLGLDSDKSGIHILALPCVALGRALNLLP